MTVVALTLLTASLVGSVPQTSPPDSIVISARAPVRAFRAPRSLAIDGSLADEAWRNGTYISGFVQRDPDEGKPATESTLVWITYDDAAIYVAARMYDSKPDAIVAQLGRRDDYTGSDRFTFYIDPYYDRRSGFWFAVDAAGTLSDGTLYNDDWDSSAWDGVWEGRSVRDSLGWTVEMRIPYSQLRFDQKPTYTWGVNFRRELIRRNEFTYYVLRPKNSSGFVSRFADLTGIEQISPPRRIEVLPYVTSRAEFLPHVDAEFVPGAGGDARLGLGSNLTLNLTVNPDFGQVEVDPAFVNLSDQEVFLDEKRPFFVEGSSTFEFGYGGQRNFWGFNWPGPTFFYSRRNGAEAAILGAPKLNGKVAGSLNTGGLVSVTSTEGGLQPLTFYGVYRAQKEFPKGKQGLGFMATAAVRDVNDPLLVDAYNSSGLGFGADGWVFLDSSKTWVTTGWVGVSRIAGSQARMLDVQTNSVHYFQQPDAENLPLDSSATSLPGVAARWTLAKQKGATFVNAAFGMISPGYEVNDLGAQSATGLLNWHAGGGRQWTKPTKAFRYREVLGALFSRYDWDRNTTGQGIWASTYMEFKNYWWTNVNVAYNPETFNNRRTRGGPITLNIPGFETNLNFGSDGRKRVSFNMWAGMYYQESYQYDWWSGGGLRFRPASNITLSVEPNFSGGRSPTQYINEYADSTATATYSKRYVFADIDRMELSAGIRLNWTFTPKLSFQLYTQPFISAGDFGNYRSLSAPRTYNFDVYTEANGTYRADSTLIYPNGPSGDPIQLYPNDPGHNPDFNYRSLRGNAVLRWEYLPGSTLYIVWAHGKEAEDDVGTFRLGYSMDQLLADPPENMFMVKISYYWNP